MTFQLIRSIEEWSSIRSAQRSTAKTLGFVPTMGALHEGHLSLVKQSLKENDFTLVSIFVNPTQFNDPRDFEQYPVRLDKDAELLRKEGVAFVLAPTVEEIYPDQRSFRVEESDYSLLLEGAHRPGHFSGMLTIVLKLLQIANAERAYFGEKDYQQLELVRRLAKAFFVPTKIIGCPTLRHADGLAMSSRNERLSAKGRLQATLFAQLLRSSKNPEEASRALEAVGFRVDYVAHFQGRRLGAVWLEGVRLIDNFDLQDVAHDSHT